MQDEVKIGKSATLLRGDCLELMEGLPGGSVDMVLADLPYGTTNAEWDRVLDRGRMWPLVMRLISPIGAVCLFGSEPFSTELRAANIKCYKYDWIWEKTMTTGFLHAKNAPLKIHENISVFSKGAINHASCTDRRMTYNPQMREGKPYRKTNRKKSHGMLIAHSSKETETINSGTRFPTSVLRFPKGNHGLSHPAEKPVALLEYLIRTYTNERDTVLDFCMGSGSTGVACIRTGRRFIGMELDSHYFEVAAERIRQEAEKGVQMEIDTGTE